MSTGQVAITMADSEVDHHLSKSRYGSFRLTPAIRPALDLEVVPEQGFRIDRYTDPQTRCEIAMVAAAVSAEILFDLFLELVGELNGVVDVILLSRHGLHGASNRAARDYIREHVDLPVLQSYCYQFQEILTDDGCTGLAVVDPKGPVEIQFDDHKLIFVYANRLAPFLRVFQRFGVPGNADLRLISEGAHLHSTAHGYEEQLEDFRLTLGADQVGP